MTAFMTAFVVTAFLCLAGQPAGAQTPEAPRALDSNAGEHDAAPEPDTPDTQTGPDVEGGPDEEQAFSPEGYRFGPEPDPLPEEPPGAFQPRGAPPEAPDDMDRPDRERAAFPCERLEHLWAGPYADPSDANPSDTDDAANRPASTMDAANTYAEYFRHLFLTGENTPTCEVRHDPLITLANACAGVARGRDSVTNLAGLIASDPAMVQAVWLMDAVVRHDRAHAAVWQAYFGPGPAFRIIGLMFDELPRGGPPVFEALLRLTESAQGVYADYTARRFISLFVNRPQWVLLNAERLIPFGPALRAIFCNYLSIRERETLVLRYGEFPYSDAQAAIIELIACL